MIVKVANSNQKRVGNFCMMKFGKSVCQNSYETPQSRTQGQADGYLIRSDGTAHRRICITQKYPEMK